MSLPRLLADENCPPPSVRFLREHGFDVLAIAETSPGLTDLEVLRLASSQQRWLPTFDLDFGELAFNRQLGLPPAIILVRADEGFLELIVEAITGELIAAAGFFVLDERGIRWRPFSTELQ